MNSYGKNTKSSNEGKFLVNNFVDGMEEKINKVDYNQINTQTNRQ